MKICIKEVAAMNKIMRVYLRPSAHFNLYITGNDIPRSIKT